MSLCVSAVCCLLPVPIHVTNNDQTGKGDAVCMPCVYREDQRKGNRNEDTRLPEEFWSSVGEEAAARETRGAKCIFFFHIQVRTAEVEGVNILCFSHTSVEFQRGEMSQKSRIGGRGRKGEQTVGGSGTVSPVYEIIHFDQKSRFPSCHVINLSSLPDRFVIFIPCPVTITRSLFLASLPLIRQLVYQRFHTFTTGLLHTAGLMLSLFPSLLLS